MKDTVVQKGIDCALLYIYNNLQYKVPWIAQNTYAHT